MRLKDDRPVTGAAREKQCMAIRREGRGTIIPRPGDDTGSEDLRRWTRRRWRGGILSRGRQGRFALSTWKETRETKKGQTASGHDCVLFASNAPTLGLEHPNRLAGREIGDMVPIPPFRGLGRNRSLQMKRLCSRLVECAPCHRLLNILDQVLGVTKRRPRQH